MNLSFQRLALTTTLHKLSFLMLLMPIFISYLTVTFVAFQLLDSIVLHATTVFL